MGTTHIYIYGTLTIKCFTNGHGTTTIATIRDIKPEDIKITLDQEIQAYLKRCRFKDCERWISWKYETY